MFFSDPNVALEVGLFIRAIMYALLFFGMGVVVWQSQESPFGIRAKKKVVKALSILCFALAVVNVFMAFEWLLLYLV